MNNKEWYDKWREKYTHKRFISFSGYVTDKEKQILKKLNIEIEDKIYTEYEFDCIESDLYRYYGERKKRESLGVSYRERKKRESLGVSYREIKKLWDLFNKMSSDYNL